MQATRHAVIQSGRFIGSEMLLLVTLIGVAAASVKATDLAGTGRASIGVLVALPLGLLVATLATTHFRIIVLGLLACRSSLDAFHVDAPALGSADPATVVGVVFIFASTIWLMSRALSGSLRPL